MEVMNKENNQKDNKVIENISNEDLKETEKNELIDEVMKIILKIK